MINPIGSPEDFFLHHSVSRQQQRQLNMNVQISLGVNASEIAPFNHAANVGPVNDAQSQTMNAIAHERLGLR